MLPFQEALIAIAAGEPNFHRRPDPLYRAAARCPEPVLRLDDDGPWWCCTFPAAGQVLESPATFRMGAPGAGEPEGFARHWLELLDGESHRTRRRAVQAAVTDVPVTAILERSVSALDLAESCDLLADVFVPFWRRFQSVWLGLPSDELDGVMERVPSVLAVVMDLERTADDEQAAVGTSAGLARFVERRPDRGGVVGALVRLGLPPAQIAAHVVNLVVDMSVVPSALAVCAARIIDDPAVRREATVAGQLPAVLNECLRLDPPQMLLVRQAMTTVELGGRTICPDDQVVIVLGVANRDGAVFRNPHAFRSQRPSALSFGLGAHSCLGRRLFLRVGERLIGELLRRTHGMTRAGASVPARQVGIRDVGSLPVQFLAGEPGLGSSLPRTVERRGAP